MHVSQFLHGMNWVTYCWLCRRGCRKSRYENRRLCKRESNYCKLPTNSVVFDAEFVKLFTGRWKVTLVLVLSYPKSDFFKNSYWEKMNESNI